MVFSSLVFLFAFLPAVLLSYYISPKKIRNCVLLIASLLFYSWGEPVYILIMVFATVFDYVNGILIQNAREKGQQKRAKMILVLSLVVNLGVLLLFKYSGFFVENINAVFSSGIKPLGLVLPIGISFYTFQTMSYTIDVYRGDVKAQRNVIDYSAFVTMFPQLVAGPIVRYKDISEQLSHRTETTAFFSDGVRRFIKGLFKKVMLANNIGALWTQISSGAIDELPAMTAWLGALAFTFQIYFDFSGYSDMAIGLGMMFGFKFPENFNHPYRAKSISEFWRRWHISLGSWFRDYVYFPLGGSRRGTLKTVRNLLVVWGLTGFWHGASWNFLLWGMLFGVLLVIEKTFLLRRLEKLPAIARHFYTMFFVILSWVIFAFDDIRDVGRYLKAMFGANAAETLNSATLYLAAGNAVLLIACAILSIGVPYKKKLDSQRMGKAFSVIQMAALAVMFFISVTFLIGGTYNPFLYFRF